MAEKTKILIVNAGFNKGGAAHIAQVLHNALNNSRTFSSYLAYGRGKKIRDMKIVKLTRWPEVYLHALLTRATGLQGYGTYLSTKRLERFILTQKFDLIHLHNIHGYYLDLSFMKFLGNLNIPVIWTLHDNWPITGRCSSFFECTLWRKGCGDCPNLSSYPRSYFDSSAFMWRKKKERFTSIWNPIIVCPSLWLADIIRESYLNKFRIKVIPNGVDTELFRPKEKERIRRDFGIEPHKKVILFAAKTLRSKTKGAEYFFKALRYIRSNNWIALTIGEGIDFYKKINSEVNIKELGYISDKKVISDVYNIADIFCITSLTETFPTTVLESMACGTPVVGFRVGGIPEQVAEDCGILVEPQNAKAIGKAIEKVISCGETAKQLGANCRKRVLEDYSLEKFTKRYMELYKEVLG